MSLVDSLFVAAAAAFDMLSTSAKMRRRLLADRVHLLKMRGVPVEALDEVEALATKISAHCFLSDGDGFELVSDLIGRGCAKVDAMRRNGCDPWWNAGRWVLVDRDGEWPGEKRRRENDSNRRWPS